MVAAVVMSLTQLCLMSTKPAEWRMSSGKEERKRAKPAAVESSCIARSQTPTHTPAPGAGMSAAAAGDQRLLSSAS